MSKTQNSPNEGPVVRDLRGWLDEVRRIGKLKEVRGASWDLEIGTLTDLNIKHRKWTLLFDEITGYPPGFRIVTGSLPDAIRVALAFDLPGEFNDERLVQDLRAKLLNLDTNLDRFPPGTVAGAPFLQNRLEGERVDMLQFPAPLWNEHDGGRYVGTSDAVITRDPETGWVNLGSYRVMVHDSRRLGIMINVSHHGRAHAEKYWAQGKPCPVAISLGHHPLIGALAGMEVPFGISEYDYAGALLERRYPVVPGPLTGLPLPADSEITVEGYITQELRDEGPYGEYLGYYAGGTMKNPVVDVHAVYFRNDPILLGTAAGRPPYDFSYFRCPIRSAMLWNALEQAGVPEIRGVWCHEAGYSRALSVVSIRQGYRGHAEQAGFVAAQVREGIFGGKYVVVVDEDIDPADTNDVLWAICSRTDPATSIEFIRNSFGMNLDPMTDWGPGTEPSELRMSRAVINACRPYGRLLRGDFPRVVEASPELQAKIRARWGELLQ
ncbi:MAG: UbiD family decarboxylase [Acidobacteria bacterium]|nr:UbiD family decarboxylase [Acidobacteriota bacterium]